MCTNTPLHEVDGWLYAGGLDGGLVGVFIQQLQFSLLLHFIHIINTEHVRWEVAE